MRTHQDFLEQLRASREAVNRVAAWISEERGRPVLIRPSLEAPTFDRREEFSDEGDLEIVLRVEVKRRHDITFTGKADFPYDTAFVNTVKGHDKKHPPPYWYMLLNPEMTVGLLIDVHRTRKQWVEIETRESLNGLPELFYSCPVELTVEVRL